jgi:hypothetical protein
VEEGTGLCPFCGNPLREGEKDYYCTGYKQAPPCQFSVWKTVAGAKVSLEDMRLLVAGKHTRIKKRTSKNGKRFKDVFILEKEGNWPSGFRRKRLCTRRKPGPARINNMRQGANGLEPFSAEEEQKIVRDCVKVANSIEDIDR